MVQAKNTNTYNTTSYDNAISNNTKSYNFPTSPVNTQVQGNSQYLNCNSSVPVYKGPTIISNRYNVHGDYDICPLEQQALPTSGHINTVDGLLNRNDSVNQENSTHTSVHHLQNNTFMASFTIHNAIKRPAFEGTRSYTVNAEQAEEPQIIRRQENNSMTTESFTDDPGIQILNIDEQQTGNIMENLGHNQPNNTHIFTNSSEIQDTVLNKNTETDSTIPGTYGNDSVEIASSPLLSPELQLNESNGSSESDISNLGYLDTDDSHNKAVNSQQVLDEENTTIGLKNQSSTHINHTNYKKVDTLNPVSPSADLGERSDTSSVQFSSLLTTSDESKHEISTENSASVTDLGIIPSEQFEKNPLTSYISDNRKDLSTDCLDSSSDSNNSNYSLSINSNRLSDISNPSSDWDHGFDVNCLSSDTQKLNEAHAEAMANDFETSISSSIFENDLDALNLSILIDQELENMDNVTGSQNEPEDDCVDSKHTMEGKNHINKEYTRFTNETKTGLVYPNNSVNQSGMFNLRVKDQKMDDELAEELLKNENRAGNINSCLVTVESEEESEKSMDKSNLQKTNKIKNENLDQDNKYYKEIITGNDAQDLGEGSSNFSNNTIVLSQQQMDSITNYNGLKIKNKKIGEHKNLTMNDPLNHTYNSNTYTDALCSDIENLCNNYKREWNNISRLELNKIRKKPEDMFISNMSMYVNSTISLYKNKNLKLTANVAINPSKFLKDYHEYLLKILNQIQNDFRDVYIGKQIVYKQILIEAKKNIELSNHTAQLEHTKDDKMKDNLDEDLLKNKITIINYLKNMPIDAMSDKTNPYNLTDKLELAINKIRNNLQIVDFYVYAIYKPAMKLDLKMNLGMLYGFLKKALILEIEFAGINKKTFSKYLEQKIDEIDVAGKEVQQRLTIQKKSIESSFSLWKDGVDKEETIKNDLVSALYNSVYLKESFESVQETIKNLVEAASNFGLCIEELNNINLQNISTIHVFCNKISESCMNLQKIMASHDGVRKELFLSDINIERLMYENKIENMLKIVEQISALKTVNVDIGIARFEILKSDLTKLAEALSHNMKKILSSSITYFRIISKNYSEALLTKKYIINITGVDKGLTDYLTKSCEDCETDIETKIKKIEKDVYLLKSQGFIE